MSSAASPIQDDVMAATPPRRPKSLLRQVLGRAFIQWGARIGTAWIGLLVIFAVFAPLIANSHPIVMKANGQWSSPLIEYLDYADITWFAAFVFAIVLLFIKPLSVAVRFYIWAGLTLAVMMTTFFVVEPPSPVVFERYRQMEAAGAIEHVVRAPIPYSPKDRVRDRPFDIETPFYAPWWAGGPHSQYDHWLGQTPNKEDIASRMIHASRIALLVGLIATGIAGVIGVFIGGLMGYFAGAVDLIGMRLVEIFEFIPQLFLLLMFVAFFERNIYMIMVIIGVTSWAGYARFIRAEFLKLRKQDFVAAAEALGLPLWSILFRHMLPNGLTPVLVRASFGVASAILAEATLSFLGLGLIEEPSWGQMLNQAARGGTFDWWLAIFPGLAIFLTVFAYNLIGEALRDAIDPHAQRKAAL